MKAKLTLIGMKQTFSFDKSKTENQNVILIEENMEMSGIHLAVRTMTVQFTTDHSVTF